MERLKRFLWRILFPPIAIVIVFTVALVLGMLAVLLLENIPPAVEYGIYAVSFYGLMVFCGRIPAMVRALRRVKQENPYAVRFFSDPKLRAKVSLQISLGINALYAALQLTLGISRRSVWLGCFGGYYFLLAVIRCFLLKRISRPQQARGILHDICLYRLCGLFLLGMNLALSVIVAYLVWNNQGISHSQILTIAMAAYTFYAFASAIVSMIRYARYHDPVMSAAKQVGFAAALVSMLSLEDTMLNTFGENSSPLFRQIMTGATGAAVCFYVLALAIFMIVRSTRQINAIKKEGISNE